MAVDDEYTKLLLHMDGENDGTTFTDEAGKIITVKGNVCTKTGTKRFGTASGYFDGTGDYLSLADSEDFTFGTGKFTIDCWMQFITTGTYATIHENAPSYTNPSYRLLLGCNAAGTNDKKLFLRYGTTNYTYDKVLNAEQWYHVAVVGETSKITVYLDGQVVINITANYNINTQICLIGSINDTNKFWHGYIEEFRISKGIARWTENFTPPTEAYSASLINNYNETNLVQSVLSIQSKSDIQSMIELAKNILIKITNTQTDIHTYIEIQKQQTILSLQQYTDSLTLGESGKTQDILIVQARSDIATFTDLVLSEILLANQIISDNQNYNEQDKNQLILVAQFEEDNIKGIPSNYIETGLTQNILVSNTKTDIQTNIELLKRKNIIIKQNQNDSIIISELNKSEVILVSQSKLDYLINIELSKTQTILILQNGYDEQTDNSKIYDEINLKQVILINNIESDVVTYNNLNIEQIINTNQNIIDKCLLLENNCSQIVLTIQTELDYPAFIENNLLQIIKINQSFLDVAVYSDIRNQIIYVIQSGIDRYIGGINVNKIYVSASSNIFINLSGSTIVPINIQGSMGSKIVLIGTNDFININGSQNNTFILQGGSELIYTEITDEYLYADSSSTFIFTVVDNENLPLDLSTSTVVFELRGSRNVATSALITKSSADDGIVITGDNKNTVIISLSATDTKDLEENRIYIFELKMKDFAGNQIPLAQGTIRAKQSYIVIG